MNKRKKSKAAIIILLLFFVYFGYTFIEQQVVLYHNSTRMSDLEQKIHEATVLQGKLSEERSMLETDEYIEKVAREQLGMVKEGEKLFIDANK